MSGKEKSIILINTTKIKATRILEKDKEDYMRDHPNVSEGEAFEIVRSRATEGFSPRDTELRGLKDPNCCSIS